MANRRILIQAMDAVAAGQLPPGMAQTEIASTRVGPDTVDGIAPAASWQTWSEAAMQAKREQAPWPALLAPKAAA
jgi:hypothetical protein